MASAGTPSGPTCCEEAACADGGVALPLSRGTVWLSTVGDQSNPGSELRSSNSDADGPSATVAVATGELAELRYQCATAALKRVGLSEGQRE